MKAIYKFLSIAAIAALGLSSCSEEFAQPPVPIPECGIENIGDGSWNRPLSVYQARIGTIVTENIFDKESDTYYSQERTESWVTGYIVGYINIDISSVMKEETAVFTTPCTVPTNLILAATPDEKDWTKCISVQLPSGPVRTALNLKDNPGNLGREVTIYGTTGEKYCSVYGVRTVTDYNFGPEGNKPVVKPEDPTVPTGEMTFRKATEITPGKIYTFVADGHVAKCLDTDAGYFDTTDITISGDSFKLSGKGNVFFIDETEGGYTIRQGSDNKYLFGRKLAATINLSDNPETGAVFTITIDNDGATIKNTVNNAVLGYKSEFNQFGLYSAGTATLPVIYEKVD